MKVINTTPVTMHTVMLLSFTKNNNENTVAASVLEVLQVEQSQYHQQCFTVSVRHLQRETDESR